MTKNIINITTMYNLNVLKLPKINNFFPGLGWWSYWNVRRRIQVTARRNLLNPFLHATAPQNWLYLFYMRWCDTIGLTGFYMRRPHKMCFTCSYIRWCDKMCLTSFYMRRPHDIKCGFIQLPYPTKIVFFSCKIFTFQFKQIFAYQSNYL